jgi:hypothetical protein
LFYVVFFVFGIMREILVRMEKYRAQLFNLGYSRSGSKKESVKNHRTG